MQHLGEEVHGRLNLTRQQWSGSCRVFPDGAFSSAPGAVQPADGSQLWDGQKEDLSQHYRVGRWMVTGHTPIARGWEGLLLAADGDADASATRLLAAVSEHKLERMQR